MVDLDICDSHISRFSSPQFPHITIFSKGMSIGPVIYETIIWVRAITFLELFTFITNTSILHGTILTKEHSINQFTCVSYLSKDGQRSCWQWDYGQHLGSFASGGITPLFPSSLTAIEIQIYARIKCRSGSLWSLSIIKNIFLEKRDLHNTNLSMVSFFGSSLESLDINEPWRFAFMSKSELFWVFKKSLPAPLLDSAFHALLVFYTSSNTLRYLVSEKQKHP